MKNRRYGTGSLGLVALLCLYASGPAQAQFLFTRIVDTSTPIPGGSGDFLSFGSGLSISDGKVAFDGAGGMSKGIYLYSGGKVQTVVDSTTFIPNGGGSRFSSFEAPSLSSSSVSFYGAGGGTSSGIYTGGVSSAPQVVADTTTAIPGGSGNFTSFGFFPAVSGGNVAFFGQGASGQRGIYATTGGSPGVVADRNTAVPDGTGNFRLFFTPAISGANMGFRGTDAALNSGIYVRTGGSLQVVADTNTLVPDGSGNTFTDFGQFSPSLSGNNVAFDGLDSSTEGIYDTVGGQLHTIADTNMLIPNGSGNMFSTFDDPSLSGNYVAFDGFGPNAGPGGVYTDLGGSLTEVIAPGDILDGKTILGASEAQIDGSQIAFDVQFNDGSEGIYLASSVPEPNSCGLLAALGLSGVALLRHKRSRRGNRSASSPFVMNLLERGRN